MRVWDSMGELNRFFEDLGRGGAAETHAKRGNCIRRDTWQPEADVLESESEYLILLDAPGVNRSSLEINLEDEQLTISGERAAIQAEAKAVERRAERPAGRFARSFALPSNVAGAKVTAEYKDGVLRVRLPKRMPPASKRIEIKVN